jgi:acetyl-CoA carboxylase carboxyl transferase subunit beta
MPAESDPKAAQEATAAESQPETVADANPEVAREDGDKPDPESADAPEGAEEAGGDESRRSRRLWKKKEVPGGLWLKCESCGETIYRKELEEKGMVCPACGFHFTMPGRSRVKSVMDEGSWEEHFPDLTALDRLEFTDKIPYSEKVEKTVNRIGQKEALICGMGTIEGREVVLAVLDFSFMGGSMGEVVGEKVSLAADLARKHKRPLVIFTSSGGARMHEGMLSLMQMAKTSAALSSLNQAGGFSICILTNPTTGGVTASFASVCDITLAEPGALIGFAGPRVIATTLKQELPPGFQRAEFLLEKGQVDAIVSRDELNGTLAMLIDFATGAPTEGR